MSLNTSLKTDVVSELSIEGEVDCMKKKVDSVLEFLEQMRQENAKLTVENKKLKARHNSRLGKIKSQMSEYEQRLSNQNKIIEEYESRTRYSEERNSEVEQYCIKSNAALNTLETIREDIKEVLPNYEERNNVPEQFTRIDNACRSRIPKLREINLNWNDRFYVVEDLSPRNVVLYYFFIWFFEGVP